MAFVVIMIIIGVITAMVASNKGRDGLSWFFVGLLFGPLGLIISLVVSSNDEVIEQTLISSGASKKCPYCAELVKKEALICKHCGSDLSEPSNKKASLTSNETAKLVSQLKNLILAEKLDEIKKILADKPDLTSHKEQLVKFTGFMKNKEIKNIIYRYFKV